MSTQTQLIIITNNEDIIRQFQSKHLKSIKKRMDLTCIICGGNAIGHNYNVISCGSCKAFFRRNADQDLNNIQCLFGNNQCLIEHKMRRKCRKCRLKKCFSMGMRKDLIINQEEKQNRKQTIEINRYLTSNQSTINEIDQLIMDIENQYLSFKDQIVIEYIKSRISIHFKKDLVRYSSLNISDHRSAIIYWSYIANERVFCFINLFKQINEFQYLNSDDRFLLFKSNLLHLFPIFISFYYDRIKNCFINEDFEEISKRFQFYKLCFQSHGLDKLFLQIIAFIIETTDQDQTILSLLILILLFSPNLSINEPKLLLQDPLTIFRIQSNYLDILFKYLIDKSGQLQASKQFIQILTMIFRIQFVVRTLLEFFQFELTILDITNDIAPLMQSLLHIS